MSGDPGHLSFLCSASDNAEASALRALLQANDIDAVIQGEQHRSMLGMLGAYIELRILVPTPLLDKAKAVLEAEPIVSDDSPLQQGEGGHFGDGAVCAVHEGVATATCERCGAFLCEACHVTDRAHPLCEACDERVHEGRGDRSQRRRVLGLIVIAILAGPAAIAIFIELVRALVR